MKNREPFETSLQAGGFFRREERASAKVLRDYVTRITASISDQVIKNPANRGTETSAEVLVGPPGEDGVERRSTSK